MNPQTPDARYSPQEFHTPASSAFPLDAGQVGAARHAPLPVLQLLSLGVLVAVGARLIHEVLGHGLPCALGGGEWRGFSTSWTVCADEGMSSAAHLLYLAGGTLVQLIAGLGALAWLWLRPPASGTGYAALWLWAAVNLFLGTGPLMIDPITGAHEWGDVLRTHLTHPAWRWGGVVLGVSLTVGGYLSLLRALEPLLATLPSRRGPLAFWTCWGTFVVGSCVVLPLSALRNVLGPEAAYDISVTVLGATSFLIWLPVSATASKPTRSQRIRLTPVGRTPALWGVAVGVAVLTIWLVGPGIPLGG